MKIHKIEAGNFFADGGAMFGVVPKRVWEKRYPCNEDNFCKMNMRCLLVDTGKRIILVDTGTGDKQLEYLKYYQFKDVVNFETELQKLGYSCNDVTDVILTHLHFDHCGSCTKYNKDKEIELVFPNANYWVGERQWQNFLNPNVREGDSYFPENMMEIEKREKLKLVSESMWICDEVELRLFHGHTVGQIAPYFYLNNGKTLIFPADVIPFQAALPIAWVSAYDTFPITSMEDKEKILKEAAEKHQILFFEHDAYNECCTVHEVNGKYRVKESFKLEELM
ncbi:putative metal-dependent hydrolase [uncultured Paludibacter sp.]|uniref:Putative metal-dependent hydrolase n=1 Tax=uncultured Paludibacter sp. TaxID=497635 RepID=A0A653AKL4_9BACT|nr:putative metal-dependent hydrolase [uncultured Paludibacter sp.]